MIIIMIINHDILGLMAIRGIGKIIIGMNGEIIFMRASSS